jgi:hypothetical protein
MSGCNGQFVAGIRLAVFRSRNKWRTSFGGREQCAPHDTAIGSFSMKAIVLATILVIIVIVARRTWKSFQQVRAGVIPESVDVYDIPMQADLGWQVTRLVSGDIATIRAAHPDGQVERSWTVHLRDPGAIDQMSRAMEQANRTVRMLTGGTRG